MVELTIDGQAVAVPPGTSILDAAAIVGIDIPTLCYDKTLSIFGACRLCSVEIEGRANLVAACATPVADGMVVHTESETVVDARRIVLDLLLSDHPLDCLICEQAGDCLLQEYCYRYGVEHTSFVKGASKHFELDDDNHLIQRDQNKCILCGKCARVCAGGPGHQRHRLHRARLRLDGDHLVRPPAEQGLLPLLRPVRRHVPHRRPDQQAAQGHPHLGPHEGAHHLPVLRRRLQLRPERPRRQGGRRHGQLRCARQRRLAVRQGPLPHRPHQQPRPHHHAAHQARRRLRAGELGRGARPRRHEVPRDQGRATAPTPSACSAPRAAPTKRTTCCSGSRARA